MEIGGEGGGGEAERRGRSELGRLLEAIGSSEVLEKRIPLIKQLEEFSADDLGLILRGLVASWIDSTCSGVPHCRLHRSILQVALKFSDLDITDDCLGQFLTLGAKASSWCGKHLHWSVKSIDQSRVVQEEEHNRLHLEINSLSFSISTKLHGIAAKCITVPGLEVAAGEGGKRAVEQECVLNKADDEFLTLMTMAVGRRTKGVRRMAPWSLTPVLSPPPLEVSRRMCTQCGTEKTRQWRPGPDGPGTLCNACGHPSKNSASADAASWKPLFREGRVLHSNSTLRWGCPSKTRRLSSKEYSAVGNDVDNSLDTFFDHTSLEVSRKPERTEEEELEWLSNMDVFPLVETMAPVEVQEALALDAPRARTKGRRRVTAMETTSRQANVLPHGDLRAKKETVRRCTHCATEKAPQWRDGPEGPRTLCNACGMVLKRQGRLLPEYRPANSPAFSPLLHSNTHRRALEMHRQNKTASACHGEARGELVERHLLTPANGPASSSPLQCHSPLHQERLQSEEETSATGRATAEVCRVQECPRVDRPAFSLVYHRRALDRSRKSEGTFAVISATAKDN